MKIKKPKIVKVVKAAPKKLRARPKKEKAVVKPEVLGMHNLKPPKGSHEKKRILGRGPSSGHGKTSTRGSKGQTSRAGRHFYLGFEGGQTPIIRRIPKRGFRGKLRATYQIVNLQDLKNIKDTTINPEILKNKNLIKDKSRAVKVLGTGELKNPIVVCAHAFSRAAQEKIIKAGGKIEVLK